jgi:ribose transport system ATP-binding protein
MAVTIGTADVITLRGVCKGLYDLNGKTLNENIRILDNVDFTLHSGEVHVLLGENGAGKSSLVKMICGAIEPDAGEIFIDGRQVVHNDPHKALSFGVAIVSQEFSLCPNLSVAENILLGREPVSTGGFVDRVEMNDVARRHLGRLSAWHINASAKVKTLAVADQQLVEIAKALSVNPRVLILDEPTSALTDNQIANLFAVIQRLKSERVSMVYITHKLKEIFDVGDRVTVLRDGKAIRTVKVCNIESIDEMIKMMIGSKLENLFHKEKKPIGEVVLEVRDVDNGNGNKVNLELRSGEIIGLAGIVGAGRTELARKIFGVDSYASGEIRAFGKLLPKKNPKAAIQAGIGYIPEDRKRQGIVPLLSVAENMSYTSVRRLSRRWIVSKQSRRLLAREYIDKLNITAASLDQEIRYLSGGNQQKAILGKWLAAYAKIIILDEPTRGIDVSAKSAIYQLIGELAGQGAAILMISSELQEIVGMSDRVYVMRDFGIAASLIGEQITGESILRYAMGGDEVSLL